MTTRTRSRCNDFDIIWVVVAVMVMVAGAVTLTVAVAVVAVVWCNDFDIDPPVFALFITPSPQRRFAWFYMHASRCLLPCGRVLMGVCFRPLGVPFVVPQLGLSFSFLIGVFGLHNKSGRLPIIK